MTELKKRLCGLMSLNGDERGASAVEYLIIVALVAFVVFSGYQAFGTSVEARVEEASGTVDGMQMDTN